mgnify:CR=1 FL=1
MIESIDTSLIDWSRAQFAMTARTRCNKHESAACGACQCR